MNWLDIVILVCLIIGVIHGLVTGIIKQVISLISLIAAILLSGAVAKLLSNWMLPFFQSENSWFSPGIQNVIFYVIAFILIISLFGIAAKFVDKIINYTPAGILNKLLGAMFGLLLWALCISILLNFIVVFDHQSNIIPKPIKEESVYYEKVKMIFPTIFPYISDFFKH